ncbi:HD domain-containing protein [Clostridium massiliamazoniense]|uniref:HD domain-containing protein n=1 Tax=Clostridium massiliamazoniense TaxID=1347366 RepID=UPI0006D7C5FF|nr:HD domain-containing protein [Clostridium massiliamazoniense]
MRRVNKILNNNIFKKCLLEIEEFEKRRVFCKHDLNHFLTMSRLAYIMVLEQKIKINKEVIYAVGLLHDIGRCLEYKEGIDHHKASVDISKDILKDCDFNEEERIFILDAIGAHRDSHSSGIKNIFYSADKLSRDCIQCKAKKECYWNEEKKNLYIKY